MQLSTSVWNGQSLARGHSFSTYAAKGGGGGGGPALCVCIVIIVTLVGGSVWNLCACTKSMAPYYVSWAKGTGRHGRDKALASTASRYSLILTTDATKYHEFRHPIAGKCNCDLRSGKILHIPLLVTQIWLFEGSTENQKRRNEIFRIKRHFQHQSQEFGWAQLVFPKLKFYYVR